MLPDRRTRAAAKRAARRPRSPRAAPRPRPAPSRQEEYAARRRPGIFLPRRPSSLGVLDLGGFARAFRRLADRLLEAFADAVQGLFLAHDLVMRVGARHVARRIDEQEAPCARIVEATAQRHVQFAVVHGDAYHLVG